MTCPVFRICQHPQDECLGKGEAEGLPHTDTKESKKEIPPVQSN